jgi:hypothetical protein
MLPLGLLRQVGGGLAMCFITVAFRCSVLYLPLYYQSGKGRTAAESGIDTTLFMLSSVVVTLRYGGILNATAYYLSILVLAPFGGTHWSRIIIYDQRCHRKCDTHRLSKSVALSWWMKKSCCPWSPQFFSVLALKQHCSY